MLSMRRSEIARLDYPVLTESLASEDGGGFLATVPDLPGCMSVGESAEAALPNVQAAIAEWIEEAGALGRAIPPPSSRIAAAE